MRDKKARERLFLDQFASVYPDFPSGIIANAERPDFLVSDSSRVTGIEIIDYVRGQDSKGSVYRRNEMLWQEIANKARREFEFLFPDPLMVHFLWRSGQQPRKSEMSDLAVSAATLIGRSAPKKLFESIRIAHKELAGTPLQTLVSSIHVTRVRNTRQVSWSFIGVGFVSVSINEVRSLIASKNAKVAAYLQQCDEVWLLIVADGARISSTLELSEEVRQTQFSSRFEKVLLYDYQSKQVISLNTQ